MQKEILRLMLKRYDACRKIAILTSLAFGNTVKFEEVYTEGITKISNEDFAYAKELEVLSSFLQQAIVRMARYMQSQHHS